MPEIELLNVLKKDCACFPPARARDPLWRNEAVRRFDWAFRTGQSDETDILARLGERAGGYLIAFLKGFAVKDIAAAEGKSPRKIRAAILNALSVAEVFNLVPKAEQGKE